MTNLKIPLYFTLFIIVILYPNAANGQEETEENIFSKFKNFQKSFSSSDRDLLKETMSKIEKSAQEKKFLEQGLDAQTIEIVASLKNPFIDQLPQPEKPEEKPPTDIEEQPVPTRRGDILPQDKSDNMKAEQRIPLPSFRISGLVWNSDRPQAIMNNQIVSVGDTINNCTITHISKEGVEVLFQEKTYTIEP